MDKIGILVDNMCLNQDAYAMHRALEDLDQDINLNIFCLNLKDRSFFPKFPVFSLAEIYGFDGHCISIGLKMAKSAKNNLVALSNSIYFTGMDWYKTGINNADIYEIVKDNTIYFDSKVYREIFEKNFKIETKLVTNVKEVVLCLMSKK